MNPRTQKILIAALVLASITMGIFLWQMRERAHKRMMESEDASSTPAPLVTAAQQATLYVASDADNTLSAQTLSLPLPSSPGPKARALLGKLFDLYAAPNAPHPVQGGSAAVLQVFLLPLPAAAQSAPAAAARSNSDLISSTSSTLDLIEGKKAAAPVAPALPAANSAATDPSMDANSGPLLAVVNLAGNFANAHPSGLETESLTVLSICATLRANLPTVAEVRFLVDGAPRASLAGHADLTRTYMAEQAIPSSGVH